MRRYWFYSLGAIVAIGAVVLPIVSLALFAHDADRSATVREESVVQAGLEARIEEIGRLAIPQAVWDDAVLNLNNRFSRAWAHENIGRFFHDTHGFEYALVMDRGGRIAYAMVNGKVVAPSTVAYLAPSYERLVREVRQAEAWRSGRLREAISRGETLSRPILFSAAERVSDRPLIWTATLVQPDFGARLPDTPTSAIVLTGKAIDAEFLGTMRDRFKLSELVLCQHAVARPGQATAYARNAHGDVVAAFVWRPPAPGAALLNRGLPPTLLLVATLCAIALFLGQRVRNATRRLAARQQHTAHLAYHDTLTGLPNRAHFYDSFERALEASRRAPRDLALLCIDLDNFKEINDTYGHGLGDDLLCAVAEVLKEECKDAEVVARLGGDEFVVVHRVDARQSGRQFRSDGVHCSHR